jgi:hypothetical protein
MSRGKSVLRNVKDDDYFSPEAMEALGMAVPASVQYWRQLRRGVDSAVAYDAHRRNASGPPAFYGGDSSYDSNCNRVLDYNEYDPRDHSYRDFRSGQIVADTRPGYRPVSNVHPNVCEVVTHGFPRTGMYAQLPDDFGEDHPSFAAIGGPRGIDVLSLPSSVVGSHKGSQGDVYSEIGDVTYRSPVCYVNGPKPYDETIRYDKRCVPMKEFKEMTCQGRTDLDLATWETFQDIYENYCDFCFLSLIPDKVLAAKWDAAYRNRGSYVAPERSYSSASLAGCEASSPVAPSCPIIREVFVASDRPDLESDQTIDGNPCIESPSLLLETPGCVFDLAVDIKYYPAVISFVRAHRSLDSSLYSLDDLGSLSAYWDRKVSLFGSSLGGTLVTNCDDFTSYFYGVPIRSQLMIPPSNLVNLCSFGIANSFFHHPPRDTYRTFDGTVHHNLLDCLNHLRGPPVVANFGDYALFCKGPFRIGCDRRMFVTFTGMDASPVDPQDFWALVLNRGHPYKCVRDRHDLHFTYVDGRCFCYCPWCKVYVSPLQQVDRSQRFFGELLPFRATRFGSVKYCVSVNIVLNVEGLYLTYVGPRLYGDLASFEKSLLDLGCEGPYRYSFSRSHRLRASLFVVPVRADRHLLSSCSRIDPELPLPVLKSLRLVAQLGASYFSRWRPPDCQCLGRHRLCGTRHFMEVGYCGPGCSRLGAYCFHGPNEPECHFINDPNNRD